MRANRYPMRHGSRCGRTMPEDGMPRPEAPAEPRAGAPAGRALVELHGLQFQVEFRVPGDHDGRRARSDQLAVLIEGEWRRMSLRAALMELERMVPRVMSRRERSGI